MTPLSSTNTNYNSTIGRRSWHLWHLYFDLLPWNLFQQCPCTHDEYFWQVFLMQSLYSKGYTAKRLADKFPEKNWTKRDVKFVKFITLKLYVFVCIAEINILLLISCWKVVGHKAVKRYHTTGSFQSQPHFMEEINYAFVCLNISNILLTHKYTHLKQLHA